MNRRQQLQARGEELVQARHVQAVVAFKHGQDAQLRAGVPRDFLPRDEVGVVFVGGDDNLVPLADVLPRPRVRHEVERFGGVARPDYFLRALRADEARDFGARPFVAVGRLLAERVDAPVDVGVVAFVVVHNRLNDLPRLLRGGGVVEIDQRLPVHLAREDGEVRADFLRVVHAKLRPYTSSSMSPPSTRTGKVSTGTTAGSSVTSPVRTSKRAPCSGHSISQSSR